MVIGFLSGDQVVLEFTEIHLCPPPKWWNRSVCHHIGPPCSLRQVYQVRTLGILASLVPRFQAQLPPFLMWVPGLKFSLHCKHFVDRVNSPAPVVLFYKNDNQKKIYSIDFRYASSGKKTKLGLYISILLLVSLTN